MSFGVSAESIRSTADFDVFAHTSEIDFLRIIDDDQKVSRQFSSSYNSRGPLSLYKQFGDSLVYGSFDRGPDLNECRNNSELGDCAGQTDKSENSVSESRDFDEEEEEEEEQDEEEDFGEEQEEEEREESEEDLPSGVRTPFGRPSFERERTLDDLFKSLEQVNCDQNQLGKAFDKEEESKEEGGRGRGGGRAKSEWSEDVDSLLDLSETGDTEEVRFLEDDVLPLPKTPIADLAMSYEARSAILQTLRDMTNSHLKNLANTSETDNIRFKGVTVQKKIRENRSKYDNYQQIMPSGPRVRGPRSSAGPRMHSSRSRTIYNEGVSAHEGNGFELPLESRNDSKFNDKREMSRNARLPSLSSKKSGLRRPASSGTNILSLEEAKLHKYRLPGIGQFDVMLEERDFEITPPGFDSRYNPRPIITEEEKEEPPRSIKIRSVNKCKQWLKNVDIHPLSLHPVQK